MAKKTKTTDQNNWRSIDFTSGLGNDLPPPGSHAARVGSIDVYDKGDVVWLVVTYFFSGFAETITEIAAIAAAPGSPYKNRVAGGHRIIHRLAKATGRRVDVAEPEELAPLFIGQDVILLVGHKKRDGVIELTVKGVSPPKTEG